MQTQNVMQYSPFVEGENLAVTEFKLKWESGKTDCLVALATVGCALSLILCHASLLAETQKQSVKVAFSTDVYQF